MLKAILGESPVSHIPKGSEFAILQGIVTSVLVRIIQRKSLRIIVIRTYWFRLGKKWANFA